MLRLVNLSEQSGSSASGWWRGVSFSGEGRDLLEKEKQWRDMKARIWRK